MARPVGLAIVIVLLTVYSAGPARAAAVHDFHAAVAAAFGHYRLVMYSLRTGNQAIALFELDRMAAKWKTIEQRFAASPPDIYANDAAWRDTLAAIGDAVEAGDLKFATRRLQPVRGEMSALRRRNGVFLFPDCVERANLAFERLFAYCREPTDFADAEAVNGLRRALAITVHWYETCRDTAPAAIRDDEQFQRIMDSAIDSLGFIWDAIDERNGRRVINNLRGLRSSDGLLYLRFG